ncbi:hypothetical protein IJ135_01420 [Candidatus Saccharibacteria bacterium]|nr:hypothetical protein [Candidatus Saccharibacteria bacterium]
MDSRYKIIYTSKWYQTYDNCIDYILYVLCNVFAAKNLIEDIEKIIDKLQTDAASHAICDDSILHKYGIRRVHLAKHSYKIYYYTTNDEEVHVYALVHDLQDFENQAEPEGFADT